MRSFLIQQSWQRYLILALVVGYIVLVSYCSILDHIGLRTQLNDLGHMEQSVWQVTHGNWMMPLSDPFIDRSRFYQHANLIFYPLAAAYALWPSPLFLLVTASSAVGLAALGLFWLGVRVLKNENVALGAGLALLLNPLVQETNLYDFHPVVLALPLYLALLLSLEYRRWGWYWLCAALLLSVNEDMVFLLLATLPLVWRYYSRQHALGTLLAAIGYWLFIMHGLPYLADTPVAVRSWHRFNYLGASPEQAIGTLVRHPLIAFKALLVPANGYYAIYLALQGGWLALAAPLVTLVTFPNIAQNMLDATQWQNRLTDVYYSGIIIAASYAAAVYGTRWWQRHYPRGTSIALLLFAVQAITISLLLSPLPYGTSATWHDFSITHEQSALRRVLSYLPPDAAVATQNNLGAHLAARAIVTKYPRGIHQVDYILLGIHAPVTSNTHSLPNAAMLLLGNHMVHDVAQVYSSLMVQPAFTDEDFGVLTFESPFYLFKRGHSRAQNEAAFIQAQRDLTQLHQDTQQ